MISIGIDMHVSNMLDSINSIVKILGYMLKKIVQVIIHARRLMMMIHCCEADQMPIHATCASSHSIMHMVAA